MSHRGKLLPLLLLPILFVPLNFLLPLDLALAYIGLDPPPAGDVKWADEGPLRTIAVAHIAGFVTLFALAPAVLSVVAERTNEMLQVPIFRRVVFDLVKPLNSSVIAGVGIVTSLGSLMLPSLILTVLQGIILVVLVTVIIWQIHTAVGVQFESSSKLAKRITDYVEKELEAASQQERQAKKEIDGFRKAAINDLGASAPYIPRDHSDYTRYTLSVDMPEGNRVVKVSRDLLVKEIRMLLSKVNHSLAIKASETDHVGKCRVNLPSEYGYLSGVQPPLLYVDVPEKYEHDEIEDWVESTSQRLKSGLEFGVDYRAALYEKFDETFRKLYEAIAGNSLSTMHLHLKVFQGIFPPLKIEDREDDKKG